MTADPTTTSPGLAAAEPATAILGPRVLVRDMTPADAEAVSRLADRLVGQGYYPTALVLEYLARGATAAGPLASVAVLPPASPALRDATEPAVPALAEAICTADGAALVGFRFAFAPGRWEEGRGDGLTPDRWPAGLDQTAYFQSCFVDDAVMGQGVGRRLAARTLDRLRAVGARAVVAHSWKESPHGSSRRYLTRLGFRAVAEHVDYWSGIDYVCKLDGAPCRCTAIEMVLDLGPTAPPGPEPGLTPSESERASP